MVTDLSNLRVHKYRHIHTSSGNSSVELSSSVAVANKINAIAVLQFMMITIHYKFVADIGNIYTYVLLSSID